MSSGRLPSLRALRTFEVVARTGGVRRAAEELHVTPGAPPRIEPVPLSAGATYATGDPIGSDVRAYGVEFWGSRFRSR